MGWAGFIAGVTLGIIVMKGRELNILLRIGLSLTTAFFVLKLIYPNLEVWSIDEKEANLFVMLERPIFWIDLILALFFLVLFYWAIPLLLSMIKIKEIKTSDSMKSMLRNFYSKWVNLLFKLKVIKPKRNFEKQNYSEFKNNLLQRIATIIHISIVVMILPYNTFVKMALAVTFVWYIIELAFSLLIKDNAIIINDIFEKTNNKYLLND